MPQQTNNIPTSTRKWTILCGGAALVVIVVLGGIFYLGSRPDPGEATRLATEQLTGQVKGLMDGGEFDAAAGAIESFLKDHPDAPGVRTTLAVVYCRQAELLISGDDAARAAELLDMAEKNAPDLPLLWALRIVFHRKAGDVTEALLTVAGMAEIFQGRGRDLCDAGAFLAGRECHQDAAKAFELAAGDARVRERACYQAAMCNYRLGRFATAMKYIDVASALSPNDPKIAAAVKRIEDARFVADK